MALKFKLIGYRFYSFVTVVFNWYRLFCVVGSYFNSDKQQTKVKLSVPGALQMVSWNYFILSIDVRYCIIYQAQSQVRSSQANSSLFIGQNITRSKRNVCNYI